MAFNLNDYETVETRLAKFIADFPDFRIDTELESFANDRFIVKAYIYRTYLDQVAFSTGYAEEQISERGVNATSALENCETSAIGRALANAGYATKGKRPSREEMVKVAAKKNDEVTERVAPAPANNDWNGWLEDKPKEEIYGVAAEMPKSLDEAVALVQQELGAVEIPTCAHGERVHKVGTNKAGKPYEGWVCSSTDRADQCPAVWK